MALYRMAQFCFGSKEDSCYNDYCCGSVAQRIERRFPKPQVTGSIPVGAAIYKMLKNRADARFFFMVCSSKNVLQITFIG